LILLVKFVKSSAIDVSFQSQFVLSLLDGQVVKILPPVVPLIDDFKAKALELGFNAIEVLDQAGKDQVPDMLGQLLLGLGPPLFG
jgi:hypothetical protein